MITAGGVSLYLCLALAVAAAIWDIRSRRIPNWLCAAMAITAIAYSWFFGGLDLLGLSALHALAALVIGMMLFRIGFIGAGDAKMYSSLAFAVSPDDALKMIGWTSVSGLVLIVVMAIVLRASGQPLRKNGKGFSVPYGVAIALGFVLTKPLY